MRRRTHYVRNFLSKTQAVSLTETPYWFFVLQIQINTSQDTFWVHKICRYHQSNIWWIWWYRHVWLLFVCQTDINTLWKDAWRSKYFQNDLKAKAIPEIVLMIGWIIRCHMCDFNWNSQSGYVLVRHHVPFVMLCYLSFSTTHHTLHILSICLLFPIQQTAK